MSGENEGSQESGDQGDQGAAEGEQQEQESGNLLDDEANGAGGDDGGDEGAPQGVDVAAVVADAVAAAISEANKVADRRINQVLDRIEKGQKPAEGDPPPPPASSGPDPMAVRAARMAAREYVTSDLRFLGNEERDFAMSAVSTAIAARPTIDDEDAVGREVAGQVVAQVKGMRKFYEERTKAALKKRGMLKDPGKGEQPSQGQGDHVAAGSEFEKGKQVAAGLFPSQQS